MSKKKHHVCILPAIRKDMGNLLEKTPFPDKSTFPEKTKTCKQVVQTPHKMCLTGNKVFINIRCVSQGFLQGTKCLLI